MCADVGQAGRSLPAACWALEGCVSRSPKGLRPERVERSDDSSGVHLWLVLMKAHRSMVRHAERSIVSLDMCISDFGVLEVLLHKGPQSVSEIGRRVDLTSGSITTAIDRLEKRGLGLVARAADASDRRARVVHLTRDGRARITKEFARHKDAMDRAAHGLSKAERGTLIALLRKLA
jgi:MarR family 2-MHQ and catechol resistance regulon transcriptional repressor